MGSEKDWKILRGVREKALNRLCSRILNELEKMYHLEKSSNAPHSAYINVYRFIQERDKVVADLFNDWRRTTVFIVVSGWLREGLLTRLEFNKLSEETKEAFIDFVEIKFFDE